MQLDFLMIGSEKSGTTFVQTILTRHPDIYMPPIELTYFLTPDYSYLSNDYLTKFLKEAPKGVYKGIRNAIYFTLPEVPLRIQKHSPDAKLIIVLRNPIDRAISAYFHYMRFSLLPLMPLNEGFQKILRGEYHKTPFQKIAEGIIDFGFYYKHLQRYLKFFDRKKMLILLNRDIMQNREMTYKKICSFLGINNSIPLNSNLLIRMMNYLKSNKGIYSLKRLMLYRRYISKVYNHKYEHKTWPYRNRIYFKNSLFSRLIYYGYNITDQILLSRIFNQHKPRLNSHLTRKLHDMYREDISNLEHYLGRSLKHWKLEKKP